MIKPPKIGWLATVIPLTLLCVGCIDLSVEPRDEISTGAYFRTMGDFRAAVIGIYDILSAAGYYGRTLPLLADAMGEDVKLMGSSSRYINEFPDYLGQALGGAAYEALLWADAYICINRANMVINAAFEPPPALQAEFDQLIGEAHAARALAHFDLVRVWAQHYTFTADASHPGIPIVLESDPKNRPARNSVAEVYAQIIADLKTAIDLMTLTRNGPFMMSREAAQAILSRVYLYMEDWSNAEAMATAVIISGKYGLIPGAALVDMFAVGGTFEAIFEIQNTPSDNRGSDALGGMYRATGYGDYLPAKDLLNLLDRADIRWGWFKEDPQLTGIYASHRVDKWPTPQNTDNIPVIRLAEVYLNRAEANARLVNEAAARADLNLIRQRALPTAPDVTATGQDLMDEILLERRKELCYEGQRVFDLTRHRMDLVRVDCTGETCFYAYPGPYFILPIPQSEIDLNPNIEQNPGYGGG